jgi:hypothetical protein
MIQARSAPQIVRQLIRVHTGTASEITCARNFKGKSWGVSRSTQGHSPHGRRRAAQSQRRASSWRGSGWSPRGRRRVYGGAFLIECEGWFHVESILADMVHVVAP